ncbi:MAG: formyltetrahydrofolate deformylase [Deinococcales bacterium]
MPSSNLHDPSQSSHIAHLLMSCPDKPGIVAAVSQFLYTHGANIIDSQQHSTDPEGGQFFMRMVFKLKDLNLTKSLFERAFNNAIAEKFAMHWRISYADTPKRMAILVSKYDHCLLELLWRHQHGELKAEIPLIISNHEDMRLLSESYQIPYHYLPVSKESKAEQEAALLKLLANHQIDVVVLARYMQILSSDFVKHYPERIINIHHSFLPAFIGANPYKKAYDRGVKLIGATAHYVTDDLDEGPIIEQDVARVSHRDGADELVRIGRDIERQVLARAVNAHLSNRIITFENKTIVFGG